MSTRFQVSDAVLPPLTYDELMPYFQGAAKPKEKWRVGLEVERLLVNRTTGRQLTFDGPGGIEQALREVSERFNWKPFYENGRLIALLKEGSTITLEPGAQVELSTAPATTVLALRDILSAHRAEFDAVVDPEKVTWLGVGLTPFTDVETVTLMPKSRYHIMDDYLPPRGDMARYMMRGTCSVQAAFDFSDEADAARKFLVTLSLSPIVNALFGNSPVYNGKLTGNVSHRGQVWERMDPDRSGLLGQWVRWEDFGFKAWTDYLVDRPMMFYNIADTFIPAHGRTFRDYMNKGYEGHFPNMDDWEMHLTSVFPDARLKKYLEVRGADCVPEPLVSALPALWKGLFYDAGALDAAERLGRQVGAMERAELFHVAWQQGLTGTWKGKRLLDMARELVALAREGLKAQFEEAQRLGLDHGDERELLNPLEEILETGMSPGARLRAQWPSLEGNMPRMLDAMKF